MVITLENGAWYYDLFYQITVIVSFVLFMAIGIRKKYPLHHWALIYLSTVIFASIGVRLMTFDVSEWTVFLQHFQLPETAGKTSLGAILGVVIGVFFAQKALGTKYRALDAFGFLIPVVMILQRLGCTSAGCCFGKPVSNGLGIAYSEQYPIHSYHSITGVIESGADISAFVHPVQLYMVFSQVIIGIVLILLRNKLKQSGSIFLLAVSFTTLTRFWIEFFRDPATNHQLGGELLGLKIIQWVLIGITAISFTVLVWNEWRTLQPARGRRRPAFALAIFPVILLLILFPFRMLLDKIELVNIMAQFGFFLILTFVHASRVDQRMNLLLKYSIIASLAVIWMSQTIPESQPSDSLNLDMPIGQKRIENRHTFGTTIGRITGTEDVESLGCDGLTVLRTEEFETNFSVGYVYERTVVKGEGTSTVFAVGGNYTNVVERLFSSAPNLNESNVFGFSLGGTAEWNKPMVGFKVGFQAGTLFYYYNRDYMKFGSAGVSGEVEKIHFVPALALRVGDLRNFYGIASIGDDLQNGIYRYLYRGVVGYNFSRNYNRDFRLEAGLTDRLQLSLEADLSITDNWSLRPAVYLLNAPLYSIGASYRPD